MYDSKALPEYKNKEADINAVFMNRLSSSRSQGGNNKIFYGIPGCGKSYYVDQKIKRLYPNQDSFNSNVFRTTFYLDYSNADFIGQLIPKVKDEKVTYEPNFGPFTKALKRAYETDDMVFLIIEEINRGNAAAIFGDLFQLLDRLDENKAQKHGPLSKAGDSGYSITNTFIEDYLGIEKGAVIIPSNLTIYATINTSNQNVFPLDTAFKRRWQMEKVADDINNSTYAKYFVPQYKSVYGNEKLITWAEFIKGINTFILASDEGYNLEDKQMGHIL